MRSPNEFYYGINAPCEPHIQQCVCGEEILPFVSERYFFGNGKEAGCSECICSNNARSSKLKCKCGSFCAQTDYIFTYYSSGEVCGCSECMETRYF